MSSSTIKKNFSANVSKLLDLVINSIYTNKEISIRELISNSVDACEKLKYLSQSDNSLMQDRKDLKIEISIDKESSSLIFYDNGIGMSKEDLENNLGIIANSHTQKFCEMLKQKGDKKNNLIGNFGVGFYSIFMISDSVKVLSTKASENVCFCWSSNGLDHYTIDEVKDKVIGTKIIAKIKKGEEKYLEKRFIQEIVKKYSSYVPFPITLFEKEKDSVSEQSLTDKVGALWDKNKTDVSDEEYKSFYNSISFLSSEEPWIILHNKNEGIIEFTNLLFIPLEKKSEVFYSPNNTKKKVKLYINKVFITDEDCEILPGYLRFICGVIDIVGDAVFLNISRENLQKDEESIRKIRGILIKRIINELNKKKKDSLPCYIKFWENFGVILKEGICEDSANAISILNLCLFFSAIKKKMITLRDYLNDFTQSEKKIYYLIGQNAENLSLSPHIEGFLSKGIDVLLMKDSVDSFWTNMIREYDGIPLVSVASVGVQADQDNDNQKEKDYNKLVDYFQKCLGNKIASVKISNKLVNSPVCLVVEKGAMDIQMERILINQKHISKRAPKSLEININHHIVKKINNYVEENNVCNQSKVLVNLLFDQACLIEGESIIDVDAFCKNINSLIS